jgi:hypothetical protein
MLLAAGRCRYHEWLPGKGTVLASRATFMQKYGYTGSALARSNEVILLS